MKKIGVFIFCLILLVSVVSAQGVSPKSGNLFELLSGAVGSFYDNIFEPVGKFLLGPNTTDGDLFFGKLLIFIIAFSLIFVIMGKVPFLEGHKKSASIIALAVSILSVRYLTQDWVDTVILPYSVLGIAMTSLLPFIIYFFFVKELPTTTMRKVAWIFAFVIFMGMFLYRIDTFNVVNSTTYGYEERKIDKDFVMEPVTETSTNTYHTIAGLSPVYVYFFTAILSLIMLFADKTIQSAFAKAQASNAMDERKAKLHITLLNEYETTIKHQFSAGFNKKAANSLIDKIRAQAKSAGIPKEYFPELK